MVSLNLIFLAIGLVIFIKFGGTKIATDLITAARNDLKLAKASLASDPVTDIQAKMQAGLEGKEG